MWLILCYTERQYTFKFSSLPHRLGNSMCIGVLGNVYLNVVNIMLYGKSSKHGCQWRNLLENVSTPPRKSGKVVKWSKASAIWIWSGECMKIHRRRAEDYLVRGCLIHLAPQDCWIGQIMGQYGIFPSCTHTSYATQLLYLLPLSQHIVLSFAVVSSEKMSLTQIHG